MRKIALELTQMIRNSVHLLLEDALWIPTIMLKNNMAINIGITNILATSSNIISAVIAMPDNTGTKNMNNWNHFCFSTKFIFTCNNFPTKS